MRGSTTVVGHAVPRCVADAGGPVKRHGLDVCSVGGRGVSQLGMYTQVCS